MNDDFEAPLSWQLQWQPQQMAQSQDGQSQEQAQSPDPSQAPAQSQTQSQGFDSDDPEPRTAADEAYEHDADRNEAVHRTDGEADHEHLKELFHLNSVCGVAGRARSTV